MRDERPVLDPILLVEDNPDDVFFLQRGVAAARLVNPIAVAEDGDVAMRWLQRVVDAEERVPIVVLLDLKMPRCSGFDVLKWIREQKLPTLRHVPVVVFTSSRQDPDIQRAYELGANSYLVKPVQIEALTDMVRTLGLYWAMMNVRDLHR
jgi:CheY-like chemotaxis protein